MLTSMFCNIVHNTIAEFFAKLWPCKTLQYAMLMNVGYGVTSQRSVFLLSAADITDA